MLVQEHNTEFPPVASTVVYALACPDCQSTQIEMRDRPVNRSGCQFIFEIPVRCAGGHAFEVTLDRWADWVMLSLWRPGGKQQTHEIPVSCPFCRSEVIDPGGQAEYQPGQPWRVQHPLRCVDGHLFLVRVYEQLDGSTLVEVTSSDDPGGQAGQDLLPLPPYTPQVEPPSPQESPVQPIPSEDDYWQARPFLRHIQQAAHARGRSRAAVLAAALSWVAALVPVRLRIPAVVGSRVGLSWLSLIVAPPGVGKTSAEGVAADLFTVPPDLDLVDSLPIGSGEGIVEAFFDLVEVPNGRGGTKTEKEQVRNNARFYVDEGQVLGAQAARAGNTVMQTLRSLWTGGTLGQANASKDRRRVLPGGSYTIGVCVGIQAEAAKQLMDEATLGTTQRLFFASATDPTIPEPDQRPEWPGPLDWDPTRIAWTPSGLTSPADSSTPVDLLVDERIVAIIQQDDYLKQRGEALTDPLDAHANLMRLKLAAYLALVENRIDVRYSDWVTAGMLMNEHRQTRTETVGTLQAVAAREEREYAEKLGRRQATVEAMADHTRVTDCGQKIAEKVWGQEEPYPRRLLQNRASKNHRDVFDDGLEWAVHAGYVTVVAEPGSGQDKVVVRRGPTQPAWARVPANRR